MNTFVAPIAITLALKGIRQLETNVSVASHKGCWNRAKGRGDLARLSFASGGVESGHRLGWAPVKQLINTDENGSRGSARPARNHF